MKADVYYDDMGKDMRVEDIPEDMRDIAEEYHNALLEHVAEQDDELMEKYLSGEDSRRKRSSVRSVSPRLPTPWCR